MNFKAPNLRKNFPKYSINFLKNNIKQPNRENFLFWLKDL